MHSSGFTATTHRFFRTNFKNIIYWNFNHVQTYNSKSMNNGDEVKPFFNIKLVVLSAESTVVRHMYAIMLEFEVRPYVVNQHDCVYS